MAQKKRSAGSVAYMAAVFRFGKPAVASPALFALTNWFEVDYKTIAQDLGVTKGQVAHYAKMRNAVPTAAERRLVAMLRGSINAWERSLKDSEGYYTDPTNLAGLTIVQATIAAGRQVLEQYEMKDRAGR